MLPAWRHYWIAVILLAAIAPLPGYLPDSSEAVPLRRPFGEFGYQIGSWRGRDQYLDDHVRAILGADDILLRDYADPQGRSVGLYVAYFSQQTRGKISHSPKNCLPGAGWQPERSGRIPYPLAPGNTPTINEILFQKNGERQLIFYWFQERGRIVASEYLVKGYLAWDAAFRHRTDGALLRVSATIVDSEAATYSRCLEFMRLALPQLNEFLPGERG